MKYTPRYKEENTLKTGMEYHWEHEGFKLIILDFYLSNDRFVQVVSSSRYVDLVAVEDPQDFTEVIQGFKVDISHIGEYTKNNVKDFEFYPDSN